MNQTWRYDEDRTYRGYRKGQWHSLILFPQQTPAFRRGKNAALA